MIQVIQSPSNEENAPSAPIVINKGEYSVTIPVSVLKLTMRNIDFYITGKKSCWLSETETHTITKLDKVVYDVTPPELKAERTSFDFWTFWLEDEGSGPKEADFTILGTSYHLDETNNYSYDVPFASVDKLICLANAKNQFCYIDYTASDNAGVTVSSEVEVSHSFGVDCSAIKNGNNSVRVKTETTWTNYEDMKSEIYYFGATDTYNGYWPYKKNSNGMSKIKDGDSYYTYGYYYEDILFLLPENAFIRINCVHEENCIYPEVLYSYTGPDSSGDYDFLIPNGTSKTSVVVCSDQPVLVHTMATSCPYEVCKDWSIETWEYYKSECGVKYLAFSPDEKDANGAIVSSGNHTPKVYNIPESNLYEGRCYCIIAHFANGKVLKSEVIQQ